MNPRWPDLTDLKTCPVLCPECFAKTNYALNTDRFVCPRHGPVTTGEAVERGPRRPVNQEWWT